jgi:hypothetical protein
MLCEPSTARLRGSIVERRFDHQYWHRRDTNNGTPKQPLPRRVSPGGVYDMEEFTGLTRRCKRGSTIHFQFSC